MNPILLAFLLTIGAWAQSLASPSPELLNLPSRHLAGPLHAEVHLPRDYTSLPYRRYPLCLLLHGGGGRAANLRDLGLAELATRYHLIIVAPDAGSNLFVDSPARDGAHIESALLQDLLPELDRRYRTYGPGKGRMLIGISLGGFAALHMGLRHPELFGFAASLSGVVELPRWGTLEESFLPAAMREQIDQGLGPPGAPTRTKADLTTLLENLSPRARQALPFFRLDCGTDDTFLAPTRRFAAGLDQLGINHQLAITPGRHDGAFWARQLDEVLRIGTEQLTLAPPLRPDQGNERVGNTTLPI